MQARWITPLPIDTHVAQELAEKLGLSFPIAEILLRRGYSTIQNARAFLEPRLAALRPPEEIPNIGKAVDRLVTALERQEKIVLYGDYDVDGITSLALLCRSLRALGGCVDYFIPERASEGYGLSFLGLDRCFKLLEPSLLIAVDCGTNSWKEALWIRKQGVDLMIVDHHLLEKKEHPPTDWILVNPQLGFSSHSLCSVGLVFKLIHALLKRSPESSFDLRHYLDLVALGTVADLVPLTEENRIFVTHGLKQLAQSKWLGIRTLMELLDLKKPITTMDIGYKIGPRLNAAGRLNSALESLELLMTEDPREAIRIAQHLDHRNRERQVIERALNLEAEEIVTSQMVISSPRSIVLGRSHWHHGVVGIVASRISKRWHRPTLIIGFNEEGLGKGSGRSIEGFSLVEVLSQCAPYLESFGGHAMAAGLTLKKENLELFSKKFEELTASLLTEEQLIPSIRVDAEINLSQFDPSWLLDQERLGPFGIGNKQPLFLARSLEPVKEPRILKEKHFLFQFAGKKQSPLPAIFFHGALDPLPEPPWDMAFTFEWNHYQGKKSVQLQVAAIRSACLES